MYMLSTTVALYSWMLHDSPEVTTKHNRSRKLRLPIVASIIYLGTKTQGYQLCSIQDSSMICKYFILEHKS